jgi:exopolysaccharide biosynthesis protein
MICTITLPKACKLFNKKTLLWFSGVFWLALQGYSQDTLDLYSEHPGSLVCWSESLKQPRTLKVFCIKISLTDPSLEVIAMPAEDPDSTGPAEASLTKPLDLFERFGALAAVNTNAFAGIPNDKTIGVGWFEGRPVDIQGMVTAGGKMISPTQEGRTAFWLSTSNKPHIGNPGSGDTVDEAVSDWGSVLMVDGRILPDSATRVVHPRTAIGFDDTGKWLLLMVVDGRQPLYSEGVSLYELAFLFRERGCTQAVNVDGGGSSIMLIRDATGKPKTMNKPSDTKHRPIPVMLGIRATSSSPSSPTLKQPH